MDSAASDYPPGDFRVSDADRDQALSDLSEALQAGRITAEEFDQRSGQVLVSRTGKELAAPLADLPRVRRPVTGSAPVTGNPALERARRVRRTQVGIGASALGAVVFTRLAVAIATVPPITAQQREFIRQTVASQGMRVPAGFPPNPGVNWPGTLIAATVAVLLAVLTVCLSVRLARDLRGRQRRERPAS